MISRTIIDIEPIALLYCTVRENNVIKESMSFIILPRLKHRHFAAIEHAPRVVSVQQQQP